MDFNDKNIKNLYETLSKSEKLVYLCGAGFSMSLGKHFYTWLNWIKESKKYLDISIQDAIDEKLSIRTTNTLIETADIMIGELKNCNKYDDFMSSTIGSVKAINSELKETAKLIARSGDLFITTNYDLSIEDATGLEPITYNYSGEILNIIKNQSKNKVVHLHGAFCPELNIDDIIANTEQYNNIVNNQGAQFIQNLIGTYPIIVVGCSGTVGDPNLKNFLQFSKKYLNLDIRYYYLYCKKDSPNSIPNNFIPICYGENYEDLPSFMHKIAMTRIREHICIKDICRVNPYIQTSHSTSAYSRMHYAVKYLNFIGRKEEFVKLNDFLNADKNFSWWMVTGEAGMGKSRLILEWLYNLQSDWFGFFADVNADFSEYKPFSNTVIVLDYVAGRENKCALLIQKIIEIFKNSIYKIRIILVERHYEPDKKDWFYSLTKQLKPIDKIFFENFAYSNPITPLEIRKLKYEEEREYIKNYLEKYVNELNIVDLKEKYLKNINKSIKKIHKAFKKMLKEIFHRPLYLSIFIEVWIDKSGEFSAKNSEELLECYIEKEEKRWLEKFNNDRKILNSYLKLLALSCTTDLLCINEKNYHYKKQSDIMYSYLLSEENAGKRKTSWTDLFISAEVNEKNPSEYDYLIEPLYPDIIKEFIVLYYIDDAECKIFAKTVKHISVIQLSSFLIHALDDFPYNKKFVEMIMTEPDEDCEHFDYFLGLAVKMFYLPDHDRITNHLLNTSKQVTKDFGLYEMYTWNQLAEIQGYRLFKGEVSVDNYIEKANKFTDFVNKKFELQTVKETAINIMEIWFKGLHNSEKIKYSEEYLTSIKNIVDNMPMEDDMRAKAATIYCECYQKQLILHARQRDYDKCKKDIDIIEEYLNIFPGCENIYNSYVHVISDYVLTLCGSQEFNRIEKFLPKLKKLYEQYNDEKLAESLSIIYANFFSLRINECINQDKDIDVKDKNLQLYKTGIETLLNKYPDNEHIVKSFVSMKSNLLMTLCLYKHEVKLDDKLLQTFREYHTKWNNNIDIIEGLGKLIYIKALNLISQEKIKQVMILIKELENLEIKSRPIYKEYISSNDELKTWIKMLKNGIELQNSFKKFM